MPRDHFRFHRFGITVVRVAIEIPNGPALELPVTAFGEDRMLFQGDLLLFMSPMAPTRPYRLRRGWKVWDLHFRPRGRFRLPVRSRHPPHAPRDRRAGAGREGRIAAARLACYDGHGEVLQGALRETGGLSSSYYILR